MIWMFSCSQENPRRGMRKYAKKMLKHARATKGPWAKLVKFPRHAHAAEGTHKVFSLKGCGSHRGRMGHVPAVIRRLSCLGSEIWNEECVRDRDGPISSSDCIWPEVIAEQDMARSWHMQTMNDGWLVTGHTTLNSNIVSMSSCILRRTFSVQIMGPKPIFVGRE